MVDVPKANWYNCLVDALRERHVEPATYTASIIVKDGLAEAHVRINQAISLAYYAAKATFDKQTEVDKYAREFASIKSPPEPSLPTPRRGGAEGGSLNLLYIPEKCHVHEGEKIDGASVAKNRISVDGLRSKGVGFARPQAQVEATIPGRTFKTLGTDRTPPVTLLHPANERKRGKETPAQASKGQDMGDIESRGGGTSTDAGAVKGSQGDAVDVTTASSRLARPLRESHESLTTTTDREIPAVVVNRERSFPPLISSGAEKTWTFKNGKLSPKRGTPELATASADGLGGQTTVSKGSHLLYVISNNMDSVDRVEHTRTRSLISPRSDLGKKSSLQGHLPSLNSVLVPRKVKQNDT